MKKNHNSALKDHKFKKGKFLTPFNNALGDKLQPQSWFLERLPQYLWIALILNAYGREDGFNRIHQMNSKIAQLAPSVKHPSLFCVLKLSDEKQKEIYSEILKIIDKKILSPLALVHQNVQFPIFAQFFADTSLSPEEKTLKITEILGEAEFHQSDLATDIRYIVVSYAISCGLLNLPYELLQEIIKYPNLKHNDEEMRRIRPFIRATEGPLLSMLNTIDTEKNEANTTNEITVSFWEIISKCADCELFLWPVDKDKNNYENYMSYLQEIFRYLSDLFVATAPLDEKMLVILGISTYAYKRMYEVYEHNLHHSISGRSSIRCIIECYILLKYLIHVEGDHKNIWEEYQYYGIGLTKLVVSRSRDVSSDLSKNHIDYKYLNLIVNDYMNEEFINMDTSYFDKKNIREKANDVGEKELFGLYYDYDSHFEHGLWGAIRESSLIKCASPAHQFHCFPDIFMEQSLPSVWHDCMFVMRKILSFLDGLYGIPKELMAKVTDDTIN